MSGQTTAARSLKIAALGFAVWALGYGALASPVSTSAWEWAICVVGPLLIAVAVLAYGSTLRARVGTPAFTLFVIALILAALEFLPLALSIGQGSKTWASVPYELWGGAWIVGAFGVFAVIVHRQKRPTPHDAAGASFAQLSLLSSGMIVYGIGFEELSSDRLSHPFGSVAFAGAVLIALSIIAQRRALTASMGAVSANIVILIVCAWALKDVARIIGELMTDATFAKEMIFGLGAIFFALGAVACALAVSHTSHASKA